METTPFIPQDRPPLSIAMLTAVNGVRLLRRYGFVVENQNRFLPKVYAQLLNTKRKRKNHEVSKPMASLSLIPFPFALHNLSSSRLAVTHGHHKPKQGREVSY